MIAAKLSDAEIKAVAITRLTALIRHRFEKAAPLPFLFPVLGTAEHTG